jgi:hypothetical protein
MRIQELVALVVQLEVAQGLIEFVLVAPVRRV